MGLSAWLPDAEGSPSPKQRLKASVDLRKEVLSLGDRLLGMPFGPQILRIKVMQKDQSMKEESLQYGWMDG